MAILDPSPFILKNYSFQWSLIAVVGACLLLHVREYYENSTAERLDAVKDCYNAFATQGIFHAIPTTMFKEKLPINFATGLRIPR